MPQVKILAPAKDYTGIVRNQDEHVVSLHALAGQKVKRAIRIGKRVVVHLVGAAPGELLVFQTPEDYEHAIRREFTS